MARAESRVERKDSTPARRDNNPARKEKAEVRPSVKRAAEETPFWRISSKGKMKPFHAPRDADEFAPEPMPNSRANIPKPMGKIVFRQEKTPPAKLNRVAEAKNPELLQEKKRKPRRTKLAGAEKPAEKPKRPAAKVRFGDAAPLSAGIKRKRVRREMPAVELKKEKKAKRRAEKRKIALGQDAAIPKRQKARKVEKATMLKEETGSKNRMEERRNAAKRRADRMECLVAKKARKGKKKYWAPLSLR